jgi:amino acid transporter
VASKDALRAGYLSGVEDAAQSLGTLAPSITIGIGIPLILAKSGHASWLLMLAVLAIYLGVAAAIQVFASRWASAGSLGAYTSIGIGRGAGTLASWFYLLAMAFVALSAAICGEFCFDLLLDKLVGPAFGHLRGALLTTGIVAAAWYCAHRDVRLSTKVMLVSELASLVLLIGITVAALAKGAWWDVRQFRLAGTSWEGIRLAFVMAATTLAGFESATTLGEESSNAKKAIPRIMILCLLPTGIIYLLATYSLSVLEDRYHIRLDDATMPFDAIARAAGIPALGTVSLAGIGISSFAATLAGINAGSRVLYDLARQNCLPHGLARVHADHATPSRAIAVLALASIVLPGLLFFFGVTVTDAINYTVQVASYGYLGSYLLVCLASLAYVLREFPGNHWLAAASAAAFVAMALIIGLSVIPLPTPPWNYVAIFSVGSPFAGIALSALCHRLSANPEANAELNRP